MRTLCVALLASILFCKCAPPTAEKSPPPLQIPLIGTWRLLTGTLIEGGDTTVTDYTQDVSFIKIINESHFAFLHHDLNKGTDSTRVVFGAGGGSYTLRDRIYTEHLEYCTAREWEGNDFEFTVTINNDTLVQQGIEKVESAGINRMNIERYIRLKVNG